MYSYRTVPIDFRWEHLPTVADTAAKLGAATAASTAMSKKHPTPELGVAEFLHAWDLAQDMARDIGWEGDFRCDPVVFWVPSEDGFKFGFAFKQDNNGTTFVITPKEMPWLQE